MSEIFKGGLIKYIDMELISRLETSNGFYEVYWCPKGLEENTPMEVIMEKSEIFDEKCIGCQTQMDLILTCQNYNGGDDEVFWCPNCGAVLSYYNIYQPSYDDWRFPDETKIKKSDKIPPKKFGEITEEKDGTVYTEIYDENPAGATPDDKLPDDIVNANKKEGKDETPD